MNRLVTKNKPCIFFVIILNLLLLLNISTSSVVNAEEVAIFGDDSRRDPVCESDSMARRISAVAKLSPGVAALSGGTAFLISPENHVLTAAHAVPEESDFITPLTLTFSLQARDCESDSINIGPVVEVDRTDLVTINRDLDYALFKIDYENIPYNDVAVSGWGLGWLKLDPDTRLTQLDNKGLYIPAFNMEFGKLMLSQDELCQIIAEKRDCNGQVDACLAHQCDIMQSNSGAPVFLSANNQVVGLHIAHRKYEDSGEPIEGLSAKIRRIYPEIRDYLPSAYELADDDGDGMPNGRDNCPDIPNTGTCISGNVGIRCFGHTQCDTSFGAWDGICEGSQLDEDHDGVGDVCASIDADPFEPNDTEIQAAEISPAFYRDLSIHDATDRDFFIFTTPYDTNYLMIIITHTSVSEAQIRDMAIRLRYRDCDFCSWINIPSAALESGATGWKYVRQSNIPADSQFEIEAYEANQQGPFNYDLYISFGGEQLTPDRYEDNDSAATATTFAGCDYTGQLSIDNSSDADYFKIEALGYSVSAELSFNPLLGDLQFYLDSTQATDTSVSHDGNTKTLRITGCGQSPSSVLVEGEPNFYNICIRRVPVQEGCDEYRPQIPLVGSGTFVFTPPPIGPGDIPEEVTLLVRDSLYAVLSSESPTEVFWSVVTWLDNPDGEGTLPLVVELHCQKGSEPHPATVNTIGQAWSGTGTGQCFGPDDMLHGFTAVSDMVSAPNPWTGEQGHGILTIEGYLDTDGDGISDQVEIDTGTDPNTDDTDGDGLLDGNEDGNHNGQVDYLEGETDPRQWDSDGDGVSDGVESGLTTAEGNDTDPDLFRADEDPATTTDPTRADTDGDGMSDGEEDANQNGRVDPGETSPLVRDIFEAQADLIIESLTHSPANPTTVDNITFTAVVKNTGNAEAGPSTLNFRIGGETFGEDFAIPALAPGASFMVQRQMVLAVAQNYRNRVTADSNDEVNELDESNNRGTDDYTVTQGGDLDGDGDVDIEDVNIFRAALGSQEGDPNYNPAADLDRDGRVTVNDYRILRSQF